MWPLLGRFSGFMCIGSLAGAVAWGTIMQSNDLYYDAEVAGSAISCQQFYSLHASANRYLAVFFVTYGLEFICLIIPKLSLLDRLTNDAMRSSKVRTSGPDSLDALDALDGVPTSRCACLSPFFYRTVSIIARFLSAVGLIAKVAGAVFEFQSADEFDYAASSCNASGAHRNATSILVDQANLAAAIQSSNEAVALLPGACWEVGIDSELGRRGFSPPLGAHVEIIGPVASSFGRKIWMHRLGQIRFLD